MSYVKLAVVFKSELTTLNECSLLGKVKWCEPFDKSTAEFQ